VHGVTVAPLDEPEEPLELPDVEPDAPSDDPLEPVGVLPDEELVELPDEEPAGLPDEETEELPDEEPLELPDASLPSGSPLRLPRAPEAPSLAGVPFESPE
jgi:hypothetical protein